MRAVPYQHLRFAVLPHCRPTKLTWQSGILHACSIRWDQSLVNSHALLGLSACGPNLYLYIADVDELLYTQVGKPWPAPVACLNGKSSSSGSSSGSSSKSKSSRRQLGSGGGLLLAEGGLARGPPGIFNLRRKSIVASGVEPEEEAVLWVTPPQGVDERGRRAAGRDGWKRGGQEAMAAHPLAKYDRIAVEAANVQHGKNIAIPARYVVSYFVHDGYPLQGSIVVPPEECLVVMHVEQHVSWGLGTNPCTYLWSHRFGRTTSVKGVGYCSLACPTIARRADGQRAQAGPRMWRCVCAGACGTLGSGR